MINGHLLTTENLDQAEHQIIFKNIGIYATKVEFHHIHIPVDIQSIELTAEQAMSIIKNYAHNIMQETLMHYHQDNPYPDEQKARAYATLLQNQNTFAVNNSQIILDQLKNTLISMTEALPQSATRLNKRQLGFLFGIVGTAFATVNSGRIAALEKQENANQNQFKSITHINEIQEDHLKHLDLKFIANEKQNLEALRYNPAMITSASNVLIFQTWDIVNRIKDTVQQAQFNRLSASLLEGATVNKMFQFVEIAAKSKGMDLMIKKPVDLFQIELSYFYHPQTKVLNLFLHVPMVRPENLLQFFRLIPFPISNQIKTNYSMIPKLEQEMIAIGGKHQYQLVSQVDLQACNKYGTTYMCEDRDMTKTDLEDTCLGALYLERWPVINKLCKFEFVPAKEHAFKISSNKWIVASPEPFSTTVQCDKVFSTINLKHLSIITVPEGCTMQLRLHNIHPGSFTSDTDIETKHFQWTWKPNQMFPHYNTKAFNDTMNSLEESSSIAIDYINHEIKIRQDNEEKARNATLDLIQEEKDKENIQIHSDTTFWILISFILIIATIAAYLYIKNYTSCGARTRHATAPLEPTPTRAYYEPIPIELREYNRTLPPNTHMYPRFPETATMPVATSNQDEVEQQRTSINM